MARRSPLLELHRGLERGEPVIAKDAVFKMLTSVVGQKKAEMLFLELGYPLYSSMTDDEFRRAMMAVIEKLTQDMAPTRRSSSGGGTEGGAAAFAGPVGRPPRRDS